MLIGTVTETKQHEYRVGLTPACVKSYTTHGVEVLVQAGAGEAAGFEDEQYRQAGAELCASAGEVFARCDMVVKVKEPLPNEAEQLREGQILFTYLHLAANDTLTRTLLDRKVHTVAYETIETEDRRLPCLQPMSEIAGRLSVQEGAKYLEKTFGGRGVLLGGVPGIRPAKVTIIGGGVVGLNACKMAVGLCASVTVMDVNAARMSYLDDIFQSQITTLYNTDANLEEALAESDLVIGAVLIPGAKAPQLIRREHLGLMKKGAVIVDVAIDQGGCAETSRATTHDEPVFLVDDVVHYCVSNMPGAVARSSTQALTSTTLPYGLLIAEYGLEAAARRLKPVAKGVNTYSGQLVYQPVADALNLPFTPLQDAIQSK